MITLSYSWSVALVVLLFVAILIIMYNYKSPKRKWLCFVISAFFGVCFLYFVFWQQHNPIQRLDWFLLGCAGIIAASVLFGAGLMDFVKPKINENVKSEKFLAPSVPANDETQEESPYTFGAEENNVSGEDEAKKKQKEELIGQVMHWFLDQLAQYSEEERNAIKVCAIVFVYEGKISEPEVAIKKSQYYSQGKIIEMCSAFCLLEKPKCEYVKFIKQVFAEPFANTEDTTIWRKLSGPKKMKEIINTYWEVQNKKSRKNPVTIHQ